MHKFLHVDYSFDKRPMYYFFYTLFFRRLLMLADHTVRTLMKEMRMMMVSSKCMHDKEKWLCYI